MNGPSSSFWLPEPASTSAAQVDAGWGVAFGVSAALLALVLGAMAYLVVRYRRRREDEIPAAPGRLSRRLELACATLPVGVAGVLFLAGFRGFVDQQVAPAGVLEVAVTASKESWTFAYPNGASAVDELRVPVGQPVRLTMTSKDVTHGFFVPQFRVKRDVVPGATATVWFEATEAGTLPLWCTGHCGARHAARRAQVVVMTAREFGDWLEANGEKGSPAQAGQRLMARLACNACHTVDGKPGAGPTWKGLAGSTVELADGRTVVADASFLRQSIAEPNATVVKGFQPLMPATPMTPQQLEALVAYIQSLQ